jgi:hypothetical protein
MSKACKGTRFMILFKGCAMTGVWVAKIVGQYGAKI